MDDEVEGMWVTREIVAIKVKNHKGHALTQFAKQTLGNHLILDGGFDSHMIAEETEWQARLGGFMDHNLYCSATAKLPNTDPECIGLAIATNSKIRSAAAALSMLVVLLLDRGNEIQDKPLAEFCKAAASKRPS